MNLSTLSFAYDAKRLFTNFTGLGNYSRTLLKNLAHFYPEHQYNLYTPKITKNQLTQPFLQNPAFQTITPNTFLKSYWRTKGIIHDLKHHNIQLYHGLSHEIPIGIAKTNIKSVVTIHDLILKHYPNFFPFIDRQIYNWKCRYSCENADKIIAISESTKQDIIRFYNIPSEKIEVIYQSCQEQFRQKVSEAEKAGIAQKYQLPSTFLFYVGSIIERKNLLNLVKAVELLPKDLKLPLVVIGKGKDYKKKVQQYIAAHQLEKWIYWLSIAYEDLPALYQLAEIFIYPSFYEGFGLPIIEAMSGGTPVITSNVSSMPEAGGEGAFYIEPDEVESISDGIEKVLTDKILREKIVENGNTHIQRFLPEFTTEKIMELYKNCV